MARLKASSLIESIVALTIITIILGVGGLAVNYYLRSGESNNEHRTYLLLRKLAEQSIRMNNYQTRNWDTLGLAIEQRLSTYPENEKIYMLELRAVDASEREIVFQKIVIPDD